MIPLLDRKRETCSFLRSPRLFLYKELTVETYLLFRPEMTLRHKLQCTEEQSQKMAYEVSFWSTVPFLAKFGKASAEVRGCSLSTDTVPLSRYFIYGHYNRTLFFSR